MKEVTLHVESSPSAPGLSRSQLVAIRPDLEPRFDDVVLLVSELVTNSVRHSNSEEIDIHVQAADSTIRVEVSDDGPGFVSDVPRGDGMGLMLVDKLSEDWGLRVGDRFTVWAELTRS